jgi:hypothetical protein
MTTPESKHALCLARALRREARTAEALAPRFAKLCQKHPSPVCE